MPVAAGFQRAFGQPACDHGAGAGGVGVQLDSKRRGLSRLQQGVGIGDRQHDAVRRLGGKIDFHPPKKRIMPRRTSSARQGLNYTAKRFSPPFRRITLCRLNLPQMQCCKIKFSMV